MGAKVSATVSRELESQLNEIYGRPRTGLAEDLMFAVRKTKKRKTPLPEVSLGSTDFANISITLSPKDRELIDRLRGDIARASYLRSVLAWMLTLKSVQDRQRKRREGVAVSPQQADYDSMKTTLNNAADSPLANATIATAFMGLSTKLTALAEHWGVDRDRALVRAIGLAYDQTIETD